MNQEPFYPSASTGEDIQQLLPKNIGGGVQDGLGCPGRLA